MNSFCKRTIFQISEKPKHKTGKSKTSLWRNRLWGFAAFWIVSHRTILKFKEGFDSNNCISKSGFAF